MCRRGVGYPVQSFPLEIAYRTGGGADINVAAFAEVSTEWGHRVKPGTGKDEYWRDSHSTACACGRNRKGMDRCARSCLPSHGVERASHIRDKLVEMTHLNETIYATGIASSYQSTATKSRQIQLALKIIF